jgi:OOP family OmpA-OmpF porin
MKAAAATCSLSDLPSIQFKSGARLSKDAQKLLDDAATKINENPACKVKVIGHPAASKAAQQMSYERVSAVIKYLVEKRGIAENRFIFNYDGGSGDSNTIDLQGTTEDGPNTVPAPHPNLRSRR